MIEEVKHTAKKTLLYSLGNIFTKFIGFILLPFFTSYLTVAQYGILAILETTLVILLPIFSMNIQSALVRFLPEQKNVKKISQIMWNSLIFVVVSSSIINIIFQPFTGIISKLLFQSKEYSILISILLLNVGLQGITRIIKSFFNSKESAIHYTIVNLLMFTSILVLTIYFLSVKHMGLKGVLLAQTYSYLLIILIYLPIYIRKAKKIKLSGTELKNMLNYSSPLAFSQVSGMVLTFGDRYVLNFLDSRESVGLYSLAAKFVNTIDIAILQAFQLAYLPYAYKNYKTDSFKYFHKKSTTYMVIAMFFLGLGVSLFAKEILIIFSPKNPEYWKAAVYIPLVVFMKPLAAIKFMFGVGLHFMKKTKYIPLIVISSALLNILLNIILIPLLEVYGAILASLISFVLMDIAYYFLSIKFYRIKYEFGKIFFLFIYSSVFLSFNYIIKIDNLLLSILIKLVVLILYPSILYVTGFIDKTEKQFFKGFVKKYTQKIFSRK